MKKLTFSFLDKYRDFGLLILRLGLGGMFLVFHGWPKMAAGPARWADLGGAMEAFGITFLPAFWGFMAALAETLGALLLAIGFLTRPALFFLFITMIVATAMHLNRGDGLGGSTYPIEIGIVFLALIFIGPGRFSVDAKFR